MPTKAKEKPKQANAKPGMMQCNLWLPESFVDEIDELSVRHAKSRSEIVQEYFNATAFQRADDTAELGSDDAIGIGVDTAVIRMFDAQCRLRGISRSDGFIATVDDSAERNIRTALRLGVLTRQDFNRVMKKHRTGGDGAIYRARAELLEIVVAKCPGDAWMKRLERDRFTQADNTPTDHIEPDGGTASLVAHDTKTGRTVSVDREETPPGDTPPDGEITMDDLLARIVALEK